MLDQVKKPGRQRLQYNIKNEKDKFDILHDTSENVTFLQLMDTLSNVKHAVIIVRY